MDVVNEVMQRVGVREEDARQEIEAYVVLYYKPLAACTESPTVVSRAYNKLLPEIIK